MLGQVLGETDQHNKIRKMPMPYRCLPHLNAQAPLLQPWCYSGNSHTCREADGACQLRLGAADHAYQDFGLAGEEDALESKWLKFCREA